MGLRDLGSWLGVRASRALVDCPLGTGALDPSEMQEAACALRTMKPM